ncbi:MAG: DUF4129 domain-containing protein, partial [Thermoplasmata archaeon]
PTYGNRSQYVYCINEPKNLRKGEDTFIRGILYKEGPTGLEPDRNASIELYLNATLTTPGVMIRTGATDANGYFNLSFSVNNSAVGVKLLFIKSVSQDGTIRWHDPFFIEVFSEVTFDVNILNIPNRRVMNGTNISFIARAMDLGSMAAYWNGTCIIYWDGDPLLNRTTANTTFVVNNTGIIFYENMTINKSAGEYMLTFNYVPDPPATDFYSHIDIYREGKCYYLPSNKSVSIIVQHPSIVIADVNPNPVVVGNSTNVSGVVISDEGELLNGTVNIVLGGMALAAGNVTNGTFNVSVMINNSTAAKTHIISVYFLPTTFYTGSVFNLSLDVQRPTKFFFNLSYTDDYGFVKRITSGKIYRLEIYNLEIRLTDFRNEPLNGQNITILINGVPVVNRTTATLPGFGNGSAVHTFYCSILFPLGPMQIELVFNGSRYYLPVSSNYNFEVWAHTEIRMPSMYVFRNNTVNITGELRERGGSGLANKTINITFATTMSRFNVTTEGGVFNISFFINSSQPLGPVPVKAEFIPAQYPVEYYEGSSLVVDFFVISETYILFDQMPQVYRNERLNIRGRLIDDMGAGVKDAIVKLQWQGEDIGEVRTSANGQFLLIHTVPKTIPVGNVTVGASYSGLAGYYLPSEGFGSVTVRGRTKILLDASNYTSFKDSSCTISGVLLEDFNAPVRFGLVEIKTESGINEFGIADENGSFRIVLSFNLTKDKVGLLKTEASYNGTYFLDSTSLSFGIFLRARTNITVEGELPASLYLHDPFEVVFRLTEYGGLPISNTNVAFTYLGKTIYGLTKETGYVRLADTLNLETNLDIDADFGGNEYYAPSRTSASIPFKPTPVTKQGLVKAIVAGLIILIIIGTAIAAYIIRKRQIGEIEAILEEAIITLQTTNEYQKVIIETYINLVKFLKEKGFLKAKHETPREFERAIYRFTRIRTRALDNFISIFEEAVYSRHDIGIDHRERAIKTFRQVQEQINTTPVKWEVVNAIRKQKYNIEKGSY